MIHYKECPICRSHNIFSVLEVTDHMVSKKVFPLWECGHCSGRFTQDVPGEDEIAAYYASEEYISHTETREGLINKAYHAVRTFTLNQKRRSVERYTGKHKGSVLDIGCGTGAFLKVMSDAGWTVKGLEPDESARKTARDRGIPVGEPGEIYRLQQGFDAITLWHVLEHVHDLHGYLDRIEKMLNENGVLFVAVPNFTSGDAVHYREHWAAYDVPRHLYHFSPYSMKLLMAGHGLRVVEMLPMWFDSFYVSMLSERYRRGSNALVPATIAGLRSNVGVISGVDKCSSVIYIITKLSRQ